MPKDEKVSLEDAATAYLALLDSGGGNNRRQHRILGLMRDALKDKRGNVGPIMPEDERPELDEDQEQAVEFNVWAAARIDDLVHPGGRLQKAREAVDTILKKAEEGTLAENEARRTAAVARVSAEERGAETAEENAEREERIDKIAAGESVPKAKKPATSSSGSKTSSVSTTGSTKGS